MIIIRQFQKKSDRGFGDSFVRVFLSSVALLTGTHRGFLSDFKLRYVRDACPLEWAKNTFTKLQGQITWQVMPYWVSPYRTFWIRTTSKKRDFRMKLGPIMTFEHSIQNVSDIKYPYLLLQVLTFVSPSIVELPNRG